MGGSSGVKLTHLLQMTEEDMLALAGSSLEPRAESGDAAAQACAHLEEQRKRPDEAGEERQPSSPQGKPALYETAEYLSEVIMEDKIANEDYTDQCLDVLDAGHVPQACNDVVLELPKVSLAAA